MFYVSPSTFIGNIYCSDPAVPDVPDSSDYHHNYSYHVFPHEIKGWEVSRHGAAGWRGEFPRELLQIQFATSKTAK